MAQGYLNLLSKSLSSQIVIQWYLHRKSYKVRISKSKAKEQNTCLLRSRFTLVLPVLRDQNGRLQR